jgi:hypothetical protein
MIEDRSHPMTSPTPRRPYPENADRSSPIVVAACDWRGWIAVAWVLIWGGIYLRTAVVPRASKAIAWVISANR